MLNDRYNSDIPIPSVISTRKNHFALPFSNAGSRSYIANDIRDPKPPNDTTIIEIARHKLLSCVRTEEHVARIDGDRSDLNDKIVGSWRITRPSPKSCIFRHNVT